MTITLMRDTVTNSTLWVETTDVANYVARGYVVEEEPRPDPRSSTITLMRHRVSGKCMWVPTLEIHDYIDRGFEVHEDQNATVEPFSGPVGVAEAEAPGVDEEPASDAGPDHEHVPTQPGPSAAEVDETADVGNEDDAAASTGGGP